MAKALKPQTRKILNHLVNDGYITPSIAAITYGIWRLAPAIYDLRKAGYAINTAIKEDAAGHRYSYYTIAKA